MCRSIRFDLQVVIRVRWYIAFFRFSKARIINTLIYEQHMLQRYSILHLNAMSIRPCIPKSNGLTNWIPAKSALDRFPTHVLAQRLRKNIHGTSETHFFTACFNGITFSSSRSSSQPVNAISESKLGLAFFSLSSPKFRLCPYSGYRMKRRQDGAHVHHVAPQKEMTYNFK